MPFSEWNQHTLEDLKNAIQQALEHGQLFDDENSAGNDGARRPDDARADGHPARKSSCRKWWTRGRSRSKIRTSRRARAAGAGDDKKVKFEVTDKSLDFPRIQDPEGSPRLPGQEQLSVATIRATLGPPGSRPAGRRKPYEFGDTLNLDISETLFSAIRREGAKVPPATGVLGPARAPVRVSELLPRPFSCWIAATA